MTGGIAGTAGGRIKPCTLTVSRPHLSGQIHTPGI